MVGANVKAEALALMEQRSALEAQMDAIISRLCRPGGPGLTGNLIDKEGFPRSDIDIPSVRADRQRLSALRNDHKEITVKIEQDLYILHSASIFKDSSTLPQKRTAEGEQVQYQRAAPQSIAVLPVEDQMCPMEEDKQPLLPFAIVDEVTEGSPAALDGLRIGDQLLKFGTVEGGDNFLNKLAIEGQHNQGRAVCVTVLRRGIEVHLSVTPRQWSGRGLLGYFPYALV